MKKNNRIQRIFHPIGQGAFYSERHQNFNVVYDCGNWKNTKLSSNVVKNSFNHGDEIDILFISHFDYDHICKISILKKEFRIKRVILPLLHEDEKVLLVNIYRTLGEGDISLLIDKPEEYFGSETIIIRVESPDNNKSSIEGDSLDIDSISIKDSSVKIIQSGTILRFNSWVYIPFNYECFDRKKELESLFKSFGLDITKFRNSIDYAIKSKKEIKEIYDKVSGGINQNSMLLYSGPNNIHGYFKTFNRNYWECFSAPYCCGINIIDYARVGCIYTGDANLNICDLKHIYRKYWHVVGTIQIPHHGDLKSFIANILNERYYICPISVGTNNTYGHPAGQVISEIIKNNCYPVMITEKLDSTLVEVIEY